MEMLFFPIDHRVIRDFLTFRLRFVAKVPHTLLLFFHFADHSSVEPCVDSGKWTGSNDLPPLTDDHGHWCIVNDPARSFFSPPIETPTVSEALEGKKNSGGS